MPKRRRKRDSWTNPRRRRRGREKRKKGKRRLMERQRQKGQQWILVRVGFLLSILCNIFSFLVTNKLGHVGNSGDQIISSVLAFL